MTKGRWQLASGLLSSSECRQDFSRFSQEEVQIASIMSGALYRVLGLAGLCLLRRCVGAEVALGFTALLCGLGRSVRFWRRSVCQNFADSDTELIRIDFCGGFGHDPVPVGSQGNTLVEALLPKGYNTSPNACASGQYDCPKFGRLVGFERWNRLTSTTAHVKSKNRGKSANGEHYAPLLVLGLMVRCGG